MGVYIDKTNIKSNTQINNALRLSTKSKGMGSAKRLYFVLGF